MFGKTPLAMIATDGFWGPPVDFIIKDVPIWAGGEKGFDPLGVTDALPVYLCREAELKHGRVCMLATVGWIATDLGVRFPGAQFQNVSTIQAHDKMVEAGIMGPLLATVA